ncbi:Spo7-like protein-domain-containing protein [Leucosporidium creatinivorum]|uniref:Transmembrane protein 188 n=1 Tax=Leucosporidium creatinivorum TaxID=106004 RepID=A0A1Y2G1J8_9BASI|nr:Spo7-like protein-domain-containing protein [Leucosporidium creatinivorum]
MHRSKVESETSNDVGAAQGATRTSPSPLSLRRLTASQLFLKLAPRTRPAARGDSFSPPANLSSYKDLLIFEERLKQNAERLQKQRRKYEAFLISLIIFIVYLGYTVLILPSIYSLVHYGNVALLLVSLVTLGLFFATGMYSEKIAYAYKFVPQANRALRPLNIYLNTRHRSRFSFLNFFRFTSTPSSPAVTSTSRSTSPNRNTTSTIATPAPGTDIPAAAPSAELPLPRPIPPSPPSAPLAPFALHQSRALHLHPHQTQLSLEHHPLPPPLRPSLEESWWKWGKKGESGRGSSGSEKENNGASVGGGGGRNAEGGPAQQEGASRHRGSLPLFARLIARPSLPPPPLRPSLPQPAAEHLHQLPTRYRHLVGRLEVGGAEKEQEGEEGFAPRALVLCLRRWMRDDREAWWLILYRLE